MNKDPQLRATCPECGGPVSDVVLLVGLHKDDCRYAMYEWKELPGSQQEKNVTDSIKGERVRTKLASEPQEPDEDPVIIAAKRLDGLVARSLACEILEPCFEMATAPHRARAERLQAELLTVYRERDEARDLWRRAIDQFIKADERATAAEAKLDNLRALKVKFLRDHDGDLWVRLVGANGHVNIVVDKDGNLAIGLSTKPTPETWEISRSCEQSELDKSSTRVTEFLQGSNDEKDQ